MTEDKQEPENESVTIEFPIESVIDIGGTRFFVTAHYDETQDNLKTKVGRLLKNEVSKMVQPPMPIEPK